MRILAIVSFVLIVQASVPLFAQQENNAAGPVYSFSKIVKTPFDETTNRVKQLLKEQGFSVVTELDMDQKIKEKIEGADMNRYKLLGVCNAKLAYRAVQAEPNIGLFLPCKMIVREIDSETTEVVSIDPAVMMSMLGNPALVPLGEEVGKSLRAVIGEL